jgi:hypothetical protein
LPVAEGGIRTGSPQDLSELLCAVELGRETLDGTRKSLVTDAVFQPEHPSNGKMIAKDAL